MSSGPISQRGLAEGRRFGSCAYTYECPLPVQMGCQRPTRSVTCSQGAQRAAGGVEQEDPDGEPRTPGFVSGNKREWRFFIFGRAVLVGADEKVLDYLTNQRIPYVDARAAVQHPLAVGVEPARS